VSQGVEIAVVVQGLAMLLQAVAEAGAEVLEQRRLRTADGKVHEVDCVVRDAEGGQAGVKVDPKTQRAVFVPADGACGKGQALAGRIAQRYAYARVREQLGRQGYELAREERQKDGTVKLVLSRWR
jgi:hypothetical protein